ncbi:MAG: rhomboid family intramembrane serine protease [Moorea sp. SIO2B7]|nr:rhomboid family intramembrane serine protease [Moorena sp. SIO2B7]
MDFNHLLVWIVCFSCITFLIRVARSSIRNSRGWIIVSTSIIAITIGMSYLDFAWSGIVGCILWGIFLLLPMIGFANVNQLVNQERYSKARKLSSRLRWLHPADGWLENPKLLKALEMGHRGEINEAEKILHSYQPNSPIGRHAQVLLYSMKANWLGCLQWFREQIPEKILDKEPLLLAYYLRALGETGDLNNLLSNLERAERILEKTGDAVKLNLVRMFALAFCGQSEQVWRLFDSSLAIYPEHIQTFWLATAQIAAGNHKFAREQLLALRERSNIVQSNAIDWRLSQSPVNPEQELTNLSREIITRLRTELKQEARYKNLIKFNKNKAQATTVLISLNLFFFAGEIVAAARQENTQVLKIIITGSSTNYDSLEQSLHILENLGGLVAQNVWHGEWWRLLTANFLHFGWVHLLTNMIGLYFLGTFVESSLGIGRYLIAYLVSGIGSMLAFSILMMKIGVTDQILVGASAAIMGLIGVIGAIFFWGWRKEKSRIAAKRLRFVLLVIGLQFVFDLMNPQVSFLSHLLGLIWGFLIGSFL